MPDLIEHSSIPVVLYLLNCTPETWTAEDCEAASKFGLPPVVFPSDIIKIFSVALFQPLNKNVKAIKIYYLSEGSVVKFCLCVSLLEPFRITLEVSKLSDDGETYVDISEVAAFNVVRSAKLFSRWYAIIGEGRGIRSFAMSGTAINKVLAKIGSPSFCTSLAERTDVPIACLPQGFSLTTPSNDNPWATGYIVNATNETMKLVSIRRYQMVDFDFPQTIGPGEVITARITFEVSWPFINKWDDYADAYYELSTSKKQFVFHAKWCHAHIHFYTLETKSCKPGTWYRLGSNLDVGKPEVLGIVIGGKPGNYWGTGYPVDQFFGADYDFYKDKRLCDICIGGAHDAGMSQVHGHTTFGTRCNVITQSQDVARLLELGIRYFDLRPVIHSGEFYTGHYGNTHSFLGWQGANGMSMSDIIDQLNKFLASRKEVVILTLTHSLNTDSGYHEFTKEEWTNLFKELQKIQYLYLNFSGEVLKQKVGDIIGAKSAVILLVDGENAPLDEWKNKGFFNYPSDFIYNSYSNTDDADVMRKDQIKKLKANQGQYFVLSWTLTQLEQDVRHYVCITWLVWYAHCWLPSDLFSALKQKYYPNVIYLDLIVNCTAAILAKTANYMRFNYNAVEID